MKNYQVNVRVAVNGREFSAGRFVTLSDAEYHLNNLISQGLAVDAWIVTL
jgi:hypothetical protein